MGEFGGVFELGICGYISFCRVLRASAALTEDVVAQAGFGCGSMNGAYLGCFILHRPREKSKNPQLSE